MVYQARQHLAGSEWLLPASSAGTGLASNPRKDQTMAGDYYTAVTENGEQHHDTLTDPSDVARDLTIWLAARHYPRRSARSKNNLRNTP
jgi:hypothetical protein